MNVGGLKDGNEVATTRQLLVLLLKMMIVINKSKVDGDAQLRS